MDLAEKSAKSNKKKEKISEAELLDNRSRRNNGTLTNNDDSVGTIE